jgi:hypothetical protein
LELEGADAARSTRSVDRRGQVVPRFPRETDRHLDRISADGSVRRQASAGWALSFTGHILLAGVLGVWQLQITAPPRLVRISTDLPDLPPEQRFAETTLDLQPTLRDLNDTASATWTAPDRRVSAAREVRPGRIDSIAGGLATTDRAVLRPLVGAGASFSQGRNIPGIRGAHVNSTSDSGAVDCIVAEILRQLETSKTFVIWLMDASGSLATRREQIVRRFEGIYTQLDRFEVSRNAALVSAVVSYGKDTVFVTPNPTGDREELLRAVRRVPTDESGRENVFGAIRQAVLKWQCQRTQGYQIMIVVVTDEKGDDLEQLDATVELVRRYGIPVYVIGPPAPFGRTKVAVKWTDEATKREFWIPVDRGPESVVVETVHLPSWSARRDAIVSSGFGPYGLCHIALSSGGMYVLADDSSLSGPKFGALALRVYAPEMISQRDFARTLADNPLRRAVVRVAEESAKLPGELPMAFLAAGIQFKIRDARAQLAKVTELLNRARADLDAVEKERRNERSQRWQAHYDLMMGQILIAGTRAQSYTRCLDEKAVSPLPPTDPGKNAWELVGAKSGKPIDSAPQPQEAGKPAKSNPGRADRHKPPSADDEELARSYLERVVREHPETPWAYVAARELDLGSAFQWQEAFVMPPPGEKLPWDKLPWDKLTESQKQAKTAFEKQQQAKKARESSKSGSAGTAVKIPKL